MAARHEFCVPIAMSCLVVVSLPPWLAACSNGDDGEEMGLSALGAGGVISGAGGSGVAGASSGGSGMSQQAGAAGASPVVSSGGATSPSAGGATSPGAGGATSPGAGGAMEPTTTSDGCGIEPAAAGTVDIEVGGTAHRYITSLPSSYDRSKPYPLLLIFHGAGLDAEFFQRFFDLTPVAGEEAILVYFEAIGGQWSYNRDLAYLDASVDRLKSEYCIDESRVFATGHSAGGYFSNAIAVRRTGLVRAIAPISGGLGLRGTPEGSVAVWIAHGDDDMIVRTSEGEAARDYWAEHNGCDTSSSTPVEPEPCVSYAGCAEGNPVHYCEYPGGHNIPSFAAQGVWDFFKSL